MYSRLLKVPNNSFFLFGPRGTGKSTWLQSELKNAYRIDLLRSAEYLKYQMDPGVLRQEVLALPKESWIIIDEIQRLPGLLDEVHALIFDTQNSYHFALSGSSARKLKREKANLLAGRAISRKMFPLLQKEIGDEFDLESQLSFGSLPRVLALQLNDEKRDFLNAYVDTYLREEIVQEAAVRNLPAFTRFLKVVGIANAETLNISNIARDVGVARSTVQGYFEILIDTLLGFYLPALQLKAKIKEIAHPKFYLFDTGVLRTLTGEIYQPIEKADRGKIFETFILGELRALDSYYAKNGEFSYWRTESGNEVDIIWSRGKHRIGIEVKATHAWQESYNTGLKTLLQEKKIQSAYGCYCGERRLKQGDIVIYPFREFLEKFAEELATPHQDG